MIEHKIITDQDTGEALAIENGKLNVQVDGTTVVIRGNKLVAISGIDLHVSELSFDQETGELKAVVTDADGGNRQETTTSLAALLSLSQEAGNLLTKKSDGVYLGVRDVINEIGRDAVKEDTQVIKLTSLSGNFLGYTIPN
nr:MAG TPA: hypothetical protein [Caudoviricetes sp.]